MSKQPQYAQPTPNTQFKILEDYICSTHTSQILYKITRPGKSSMFSSSAKTPIEIVRADTGDVLGTVHGHQVSGNIGLTVHDRATTIKFDQMTWRKWSFESVVSPAQKLWWEKGNGKTAYGEGKGMLTLKDTEKDGRVIAQLKDETLTFQMPGLSQAMIDEVIVSAVGMGEAMNIKKKQDSIVTKVILKSALGV